MGLVMIRIYALHRRDTGAMVLVVLRDTRWRWDRSIIGTMEMDLTHGTQMVYVILDQMKNIHDFSNHVEISIQTHGYAEWQGSLIEELSRYQEQDLQLKSCSGKGGFFGHQHEGTQYTNWVGVIDSDFRGEVKILVFNMAYGNIILNKGEAIAQLILEKAATLESVQVVDLLHTVRGTGGFGSTNQTVTIQTATSVVQLGTTVWTNLMDKLLPRKRMPIDDTSTSNQCTYQQLHVLTADVPNNEWINPFYMEDGGYDSSTSFYSAEPNTFDEQIMAHMDLEEGLEMDYLIPRTNEGIYVSSSAISRYNPPEDTMMGAP
ncbi:hypothetical protein ZIOFF_001895 [Zingiber officinale]|uniref:dUTP diphosphatase n=1 Tax=Zingiber officinale TaxID=94328 RepID=A0A8J5I4A1_ZINOF|nr:hypothetical protein ZIOFF_001895 [Zingiber officinale]